MSDVLDKFLAELEASEISRQGVTICAVDKIFYSAYRERRRIKEQREAFLRRRNRDLQSDSYYHTLCHLRIELGSMVGLTFIIQHENRVRRWIWNRIWKKEINTLNPDQFVHKFMDDMGLDLTGQEIVARLLMELQRALGRIPI